MEEEFITNMERLKPQEEKTQVRERDYYLYLRTHSLTSPYVSILLGGKIQS